MGLLTPGALAPPEPSPALLRRLFALPAGHPRQAAPAEAGRFRRWRSDWRVLVALAYAACLALVAILGVDPLSAARSGASGMTAAGERALAEAKAVAGEKLETVLASQRKKPLTEQLDYRVYRTLAVGKAKRWPGRRSSSAAFSDPRRDRAGLAPADARTAPLRFGVLGSGAARCSAQESPASLKRPEGDADELRTPTSRLLPTVRGPADRLRAPLAPPRPAAPPGKNPAAAGLLSFFPGLGHVYLGLYKRGIVFFAILVMLIAIAHRGHNGPFGMLIPLWIFVLIDAV